MTDEEALKIVKAAACSIQASWARLPLGVEAVHFSKDGPATWEEELTMGDSCYGTWDFTVGGRLYTLEVHEYPPAN